MREPTAVSVRPTRYTPSGCTLEADFLSEAPFGTVLVRQDMHQDADGKLFFRTTAYPGEAFVMRGSVLPCRSVGDKREVLLDAGHVADSIGREAVASCLASLPTMIRHADTDAAVAMATRDTGLMRWLSEEAAAAMPPHLAEAASAL